MRTVKKTLKGYKYIDLFAGIGGFHLAMKSYDAECVFASEWDRSAAQVYENNFGIKPFGDITKIKEAHIPEHDILCGGFPCQAFSISGKQKGFDDTRGTLFFDIARIVKYHSPKILFLENVKNFEKHDKGKTLKIIITTLADLGYDVNHKVLNASDYGLPQNRERIFLVCFRKNMNIHDFQFPQPVVKPVALHDILEIDPDAKIIMRQDITMHKSFEPPKNSFNEFELPNKPMQIGIVNKGGQGERIYSTYGHACTLSAYGGGVGSKTGIYYVDGVIRKLSPRECARAQGFPDSFILDKNKGQAYKQFGNSVAVNVLKKIINEIIKVF
ncbi:MAG: DNA (cytosine-5-)-methyltransferase [Treponema sp.]|nr:DNA (cytosine-5-)-methyltransferase [Treponema sp.]